MFEEFNWNGEADWESEMDEFFLRGKSARNPRSKFPSRPSRPSRPGRLRPRPLRPRRTFCTYTTSPMVFAQPQSDEQLRWVQDCLNQKMDLHLPVNGIAGPETRRAIRDFQRYQGLRATGLVDPDTEQALRRFCQQDEIGDAAWAEEEAEIGPFSAALRWIKRPKSAAGKAKSVPAPSPGDDYIMTLDQARSMPGGGVYIMIGDATVKKGSRSAAAIDQMLKVGKAEFFSSRFSGYSVPGWHNLRVYIARINRFIPKDAHIERAIARLLYRTITKTPGTTKAHWPGIFPGSRFVAPKQVFGSVNITNILPPPLLTKHGVPGNLSLSNTTSPVYEISTDREFYGELTVPSTNKGCTKCGGALPCGCSTSQCVSQCACKKCASARASAPATGQWLRRGNQIQLLGIAP